MWSVLSQMVWLGVAVMRWGFYTALFVLLLVLCHPFYLKYLLPKVGIAASVRGLFLLQDVSVPLGPGAWLRIQQLGLSFVDKKLCLNLGQVRIRVKKSSWVDFHSFRLLQLLGKQKQEYVESLFQNVQQLLHAGFKDGLWKTSTGASNPTQTDAKPKPQDSALLQDGGIREAALGYFGSIIKMILFKSVKIGLSDISFELVTERSSNSARRSAFETFLTSVDPSGASTLSKPLLSVEILSPQLSFEHSTVISYCNYRSKGSACLL